MDKRYYVLCQVLNITIWFLLWLLFSVLAFVITDNWIIRILVVVVSHFASAALEIRLISKYVNTCVEHLIPFLFKNRNSDGD